VLAFVPLALATTAIAVLWFVWDQRRVGRFGAPAAVQPADGWFERTLARYPAEVVGAAWDGTVGAGEVKAILTRWVLERTISAEVRTAGGAENLSLRLLLPRPSLRGYEEALAAGFFPSELGDSVDFSGLRDFHVERDRLPPDVAYRRDVDFFKVLSSQCFDPVGLIRAPLLAEAERLTAGTYSREDPSGRPGVFSIEFQEFLSGSAARNLRRLLVLGFLFPLVLMSEPSTMDFTALTFGLAFLVYLFTTKSAERLRQRPVLPISSLLRLSPVLAIPFLAPALAAAKVPMPGPFAFWLGVLSLGSIVSVVGLARAPGSREQVTARQELEAVREFLRREMVATGSVPDSRLPYVFAFDLEDLLRPGAGEAPGVFARYGGAAEWSRLIGPFALPFVTREMDCG